VRHPYSIERVIGSYWFDAESAPPFAPCRHDGRVDVAIVGGGITGCAAARVLAEGGLRVRVHEARQIGSGASGRNGGFALGGGATRYDIARETYGADRAREYWRWTERALDRMEELAGDALERPGSLRLAADEEERAQIQSEYEALREDGFAAEWRDELPPPLAGRFHGAIFHPRDGSLQPARFVRGLAAAAADAGAELVEHSRVESLDSLDAEQVLIATDGYGRGLLPELDETIWPARGQVVATEPLAERLFDYPHYARQGFDYWQQLADGRIVLGGFRDFSIMSELTDEEETTSVIQDALSSFLRELVGYDPPVAYRWAGIFGLTQDFLPLVGRVPARDGVWVAAGYSGHGNVLGLACGELVATAILGRDDPQLALFEPARLLDAAEA
jgi:glycine/D-amino acid oxidase-like deaminating enzyme